MTNGSSASSGRRWFSDGASMAHTGAGRGGFWLMNLVMYVLLHMFYLRMQRGAWVDWGSPNSAHTGLIEQLLWPLNVLQFPWQIVVIGMLAALTCAVPIIIAQLYNLMYAMPFVLAVLFFGHNPILSLYLFVSCMAVSFDRLRLKSKFVSAVICLAPELLYWALHSGNNPQQDSLQWAVLYAPWALAFLLSVAIFAVVLALGHVLRYRPGVMAPVFGVLLAGAVVIFHQTVGMVRRDFQAQVFRNSPGQVEVFQDESIVALLEQELSQRRAQFPYLTDEVLRAQLRLDWRAVFMFGPDIGTEGHEPGGMPGSRPGSLARRKFHDLESAQLRAIDEIDLFIAEQKDHPLEADALYYKGLLYDMKVNFAALRDEDMLRFYYDVPSDHAEPIWGEILKRFEQSEVSIEARWRLGRLWAGRSPQRATDSYSFDKAMSLLEEARQECSAVLAKRAGSGGQVRRWGGWLGGVFSRPTPTITNQQLLELQRRIRQLVTLISKENRTGHRRHEERLALFIRLDHNHPNYQERLKALTFDPPEPDPLIDNLELAQAMLQSDADRRIAALTAVADDYRDRDGGIEAMLQLALSLLDRYDVSEQSADRQSLLAESRKLLNEIISARPDSFAAEYARDILKNSPAE